MSIQYIGPPTTVLHSRSASLYEYESSSVRKVENQTQNPGPTNVKIKKIALYTLALCIAAGATALAILSPVTPALFVQMYIWAVAIVASAQLFIDYEDPKVLQKLIDEAPQKRISNLLFVHGKENLWRYGIVPASRITRYEERQKEEEASYQKKLLQLDVQYPNSTTALTHTLDSLQNALYTLPMDAQSKQCFLDIQTLRGKAENNRHCEEQEQQFRKARSKLYDLHFENLEKTELDQPVDIELSEWVAAEKPAVYSTLSSIQAKLNEFQNLFTSKRM